MGYRATSDRPLFVTANLLVIFGLVMLYSASSALASEQHGGMSGYFFLRQLIYAALGYVLMVTLMNVDYHIWQKEKVTTILLVACAAMLLLVFRQPEVNGAHRWLRYGSTSFQPSELAKLVLLMFLAAFLHKHAAGINTLTKKLLLHMAVLLFFAVLIMIEPDLGQAMCIIVIVSVLLFAAGLNWKRMVAAAAAVLPVLFLALLLFPYHIHRLLSFLNRSHDPLKSDWQIRQSLTAVGSGGFFGLGLGASRQKLFFLPEAHSDFIFAVIGEELGLIGTCLVCLAFLFFFYRGVKVALKAPDAFGFYLGLGITLMVVQQAFINISMVLALMPTKGTALPFISQGGSSLLLNLMATGILLNISNYAEKS